MLARQHAQKDASSMTRGEETHRPGALDSNQLELLHLFVERVSKGSKRPGGSSND